VQDEAGQIGCREQQVRAERCFQAGDPNGPALVIAGCDLATLVELAVGR